MKNSKRELSLRYGITLSKKMCPCTPEEIERMSGIPYASVIGSLMYAILCTWSNIALTVSITSKYQSNLGEEHWIVIKNILKYLRRIKDLFLIFRGELDLQVKWYTELDFMSDLDDRKSTSKNIFNKLKEFQTIDHWKLSMSLLMR